MITVLLTLSCAKQAVVVPPASPPTPVVSSEPESVTAPVAPQKEEQQETVSPPELKTMKLYNVVDGYVYLPLLSPGNTTASGDSVFTPTLLTEQELVQFEIPEPKEWWLLPAVGPPVRSANPVYYRKWVEVCGEAYFGLYLKLDNGLEAAEYIIALEGEPPPSWFVPPSPPQMTQSEAIALIEQKYPESGAIHLHPVADGWKGWINWPAPASDTAEDTAEETTVVDTGEYYEEYGMEIQEYHKDVHVTNDRKVTLGETCEYVGSESPSIRYFRDLNGDGDSEYLSSGCGDVWNFGLESSDVCCFGC